MKLKKLKMPTWMQDHQTLKVLFKREVYNSTIYPTHVRIAECYIYCNENDEEVVKQIIQEFEESYNERN